MNKKYIINRGHSLWVIIFIIIIIPIHLSYNSINDFAFDVIHYPSTDGVYLFTLPISLFFIIPFIILGLLNFYKDLEIFLLLAFALISIVISVIYKDFLHLLLLGKITIPILTILGFEIFFKKKFSHIEKKHIYHFIKIFNYKIALIFTIIFFISIMSRFYLDSPYNWLINKISIFDFHQYFPLIFILLLGVLASNKQKYVFLLVYILSFYLYRWTTNTTFLIFLVLFGTYYVLSFLGFLKKNLVFLSKIFIILMFLILFLFPFFSFIFLSEIKTLDLPLNILNRFFLIEKFFSNLTIFEFLTPIRISSEIVYRYYHNELLVIISALGIIGASLFYFVILKRIWFISKYFPHISVAISLFSLLSGIILTVNLHPYNFIILSFFISYYYVLSKIQSQQSL